MSGLATTRPPVRAWRPADALRRLICCAMLLFAAGGIGEAAETGRADLVNHEVLRVCSDPANLPFSDEAGQGFENKIAELVADDLKLPLEYTWFPQATGFVRQTLFAKRCDLIIGYAQGDDLVLNSNHYYRSSYVLVHRPGQGLDGVATLADERLKDKRIGIVAGTPPGNIMAMLGLMQRARPYPLTVDRRYDSPAERMIADIRSGEIDAGILWGPIGGYFASRGGEKLTVTPLLGETMGPRMAYRITFGVRHQEDDWKRKLNEIIARRQGDIDAILLDFGVPLLDEDTVPITAPRR
ncbi:substrate-binding domain-containing protein [Bosea sp. 2KB_26]|uniref:substrate-binding domain-containing protein n=1 Tax=Bosea sp. 2KB_26 TaxID=3237475 RepID=UPI003F8FE5A5